jgi:predicted nucleic acid-binding protein
MSPRLLDASSILLLIKTRSRVFRNTPKNFIVLPLTIFEIGNALRTEAYLRKITTPEKAEALLYRISRIVNEMTAQKLEADDPMKILNPAGRCGLSFYDAAYLNAAVNGGYTLITEDTKLAREASNEGVEVLSTADIRDRPPID